MIDVKFIRENADVLKKALADRHNTTIDIDAILDKDAACRSLLHETEQLRAEQNAASKRIGEVKKAGEDATEAMTAMKELSAKVKTLGDNVKEAREALGDELLAIPNIPHDSVPVGVSEDDNRVERTWGDPPKFDFEPKDHVDIGETLGLIDFERAAKLSGARFSLLRGPGAHLERALINFMLDIHTQEHGYTEMLPPFAVNSAALQGTGQLPKFAEDLFRIEDHDLWMIPTAEVPLTNIHQGEILDEADLPFHYTAYTPCFRSEAGSYGKDTRGMLRQHQFNKVELVKICTPETSWDEHETLTANAEVILQRLELPYRLVTLSTGDLGFAAAKTYDLEVWLPGQNTYREISSCSNCTDFQARRANIRYRPAGEKKPQYVHTLNGSGLAAGRTLIAILENHQRRDGSFTIPEALRPYMNGAESIG